MQKNIPAILKGMVLCLGLLILFIPPGSAASFDEMVVFGDSLSDNGNLLFSEYQPKPDRSIYYEGRFSNGPVWVEYLVEPQRLNTVLHDRAFGGAQSDGLVPPGLIEQVIAYIALEEFSVSANTLFVIWIGGNDFLNGDGDSPAAVANIEDAMQRLVDRGAMHLLILNLPDLGAIPDTLETPEAAEATAFTVDFNTRLANMLDTFSLDHPGVGLYTFDVASFFVEVRNDPVQFGFVDASKPSPNFAVPDNFDGAGYVFWDEVHPTTQMHALLADRVLTDLNRQVPNDINDSTGDDSDSTCFIGSLFMGSLP
ncbi:MAG: SGNH/GDSL hydrolase family protein, partial [Desulfosarcina sp.]